MKNDNKITMIR